MRIVMLGWEFPPFISGGLGTACYGLTKALDRQGHDVLFILPRAVEQSHSSHITLLSPSGATGRPSPMWASAGKDVPATGWAGASGATATLDTPAAPGPFAHTRVLGVPASFSNPYGPGHVGDARRRVRRVPTGLYNPDGSPIFEDIDESQLSAHERAGAIFGTTGAGAHYRGDLFAEAERYARLVVALTRGETFDVVHAHDWLTFPAGQALARLSNKPLIVHVHSTEFDRSGDNINQRVYDVERRGMMAAIKVLCVSQLTRNICRDRYGVPEHKLAVCYNGIDNEAMQPTPASSIKSKDKIVLFLGRITMQKGPEYFINAAKRVLEKIPDVKFIVAGSGDMELRMIELAASLDIGHRVLFTGFLRGADVDRIFRMADCYVMPSVSEPFGIAPLEAMRNDVPVIISKQSGVSEVLTHALKVDFWDTDEMANKIVAVLKYPPLGRTLSQHGAFEVRRLTWDTAADCCTDAYLQAIAAHHGGGVG